MKGAVSDFLWVKAMSSRASQHHKGRVRAIGFVAVVCLSSVVSARAAIPSTERAALISLWGSAHGSSWFHYEGWRSGSLFGAPGTECDWFGVTCGTVNNQDHVIGLDLEVNNLVGTLPSDFFLALPSLETIDLRGNVGLSGSIPSLEGSSALRALALQYCSFSGAIPSFTGASSLEEIDLSGNQLIGNLPSLVGLSSLRYLSVNNNSLTGALPSFIDQQQLLGVDISDNAFTGAIPSFDSTPNLGFFWAERNQLSGEIPSLANLTNIDSLQLAHNRLQGSVPDAPTSLSEDDSSLCPNALSFDLPDESGWQQAIQTYPWWLACDFLYFGDFEFPSD